MDSEIRSKYSQNGTNCEKGIFFQNPHLRYFFGNSHAPWTTPWGIRHVSRPSRNILCGKMFGIIIKINPKSKMRKDFRFITRFSWKLEGFIFTDVLTNCSWLFSQLPWELVQIYTFPHKFKKKMVIFLENFEIFSNFIKGL